MKKGAFFIFLLLVAGSLLAVPVKAETTSYYGLSFGGDDQHYVGTSATGQDLSSSSGFSWVIIMKPKEITPMAYLGWGYTRLGQNAGRNTFVVHTQYGDRIISSTNMIQVGRTYFLAAIFDNSSKTITLWEDLNKYSTTIESDVYDDQTAYAFDIAKNGHGWLNYANIDVYVVLAYNRPLSDSEVQQIYENPLNPPKNGLVLWYAPDSVDTANGKWLDKSGNGNDGTIYGASYVPLRPISEGQFGFSYGLNFINGKMTVGSLDDFVFKRAVSIVTIVNYDPSEQTQAHAWIVGKGRDIQSGFHLDILSKQRIEMRVGINQSGTTSVITFGTSISNYYNDTILVAGVYDVASGGALYLNDKKVATTAATADEIIYSPNSVLGIGYESYGLGLYSFPGEIYLVLIYSRALSDAEIQQIYNDPLNPPKDGLVLFYSPYTYDPSTGKWLNVAPIFPTIPLAEELDGTNYGATPERVSLLRFNVSDVVGNPVSSFTIRDLNLNVSTSLPLFPVPYSLQLHRFNVSSGPAWAVIATTPNADKNLSVSLSGWVFEGEKPLGQAFAEGAESSFGSRMAVGIFALFAIVAILVAHRVHVAVGALALVPLAMAFAKYGYLPTWVGYGTLIVVGILTVPLVVSIIGGENR